MPHIEKNRPAALATLVLAAGAILGACGGGTERAPAATAEPATDRTAVVAYGIDIEGVNELLTSSTPIQTAIIYFALYLQLVEERADYEQGPPSFGPRLARSYEFSPDRRSLTFHLRDDVVWSDGVPVTAEDVRWTWQAQTDPQIAWAFADAKAKIADVEVVDPHTVRFYFTDVYANQLIDANFGVILPRHAWSELPFSEWRGNGAWFLENLVVNGAFTVESWEPRQRLILRRNERYFEPGVPKLERLVFQITPDPASQLALLRAGQVDYVEFINPVDAAAVEADPNLRLTSYLARHFYFVQWNVTRPMFASEEVRRALTMAIDRQTIVDTLSYGYAEVIHSPFTSNTWVHNRKLEPWPYDPARARELLAAHGWEDHDGDGVLDRGGERFRFELLSNTGNELRRDITVMIQDQLRRIGVEVVPRLMDINAMLVPLQAHDFDALIFGLAMDTSLNTYHYFHTRAIDDGFNWGAYSNPEVDRLIEEIEDLVDQRAAKPLFDRLQELLHEEQPLTLLYESRRLGGASARLRDVEPNALSSFYNMRYWRLEEGE